MPTIIQDDEMAQSLIDDRQAKGIDLWDEVWEGEYIIMPWPNTEHQDLLDSLICVLKPLVRDRRLGAVYSNVNVSDRVVGWRNNFRVPDVAVFLKENRAEDRGSFWHGGPDLAIEIVSPRDRSHEKLGFYAAVGTREVLLIDRDPWGLELHRLADGELKLAGQVGVEAAAPLRTDVLPLTWRLRPGEARPEIEVADPESGETWIV